MLKSKNILIIGDTGIDKYTIGTVDRISSEAPVPILNVVEQTYKLGLAANVAENVYTLGSHPILVSISGSDKSLEKMLRKVGIKSDYIVSTNRSTTVKERIVSGQQLLRIDYEDSSSIFGSTEQIVMSTIEDNIEKSDIIIVEDYDKGVITSSIITLIQKIKGDKLLLIDPNTKSNWKLYRKANVITPNIKEAEHLSEIKIRDEYDVRLAGLTILDKLEVGAVILTRGKDGMSIFRQNREIVNIPTFAKEVYDVSGAGDTVIATLSIALANDIDLEESCKLANIAAGIVVGKHGTATVTQAEMLSKLATLV